MPLVILFDKLPKKRQRISPADLIGADSLRGRRKRASSTGGDCYKANGKYFIDHCHKNPNLRLVHGEVSGQGSLHNTTFGHCWVVDGDQVLDFSNGREFKLPKVIYYAIGNVEWINNFYVYDALSFHDNISHYGHWGPWDLKTNSGL